jgi:hypothetical protein
MFLVPTTLPPPITGWRETTFSISSLVLTNAL